MTHLPSTTSRRPFWHRQRDVLLAVAGALFVQLTCAQDGILLAQTLFNRPAGGNLTALMQMELTEKGRAPRTRELVTYRLSKGRGDSVTLIRFLEPRDVVGTGLLSSANADGSSEQSLYLPALDRVRRIASDRKGGRFVGSDMYYEDLQERRPEIDSHRLLGKEVLNGVDLEVLESVPKDPESSVYKKRVSWVNSQTLLPHRVDYFERDLTTPTKRWELLDHKRIQGYWTITDSRVTDLNTGHSTRLTMEKALYDRNLPARLFTSQALADDTIEAEYRP